MVNFQNKVLAEKAQLKFTDTMIVQGRSKQKFERRKICTPPSSKIFQLNFKDIIIVIPMSIQAAIWELHTCI